MLVARGELDFDYGEALGPTEREPAKNSKYEPWRDGRGCQYGEQADEDRRHQTQYSDGPIGAFDIPQGYARGESSKRRGETKRQSVYANSCGVAGVHRRNLSGPEAGQRKEWHRGDEHDHQNNGEAIGCHFWIVRGWT